MYRAITELVVEATPTCRPRPPAWAAIPQRQITQIVIHVLANELLGSVDWPRCTLGPGNPLPEPEDEGARACERTGALALIKKLLSRHRPGAAVHHVKHLVRQLVIGRNINILLRIICHDPSQSRHSALRPGCFVRISSVFFTKRGGTGRARTDDDQILSCWHRLVTPLGHSPAARVDYSRHEH